MANFSGGMALFCIGVFIVNSGFAEGKAGSATTLNEAVVKHADTLVEAARLGQFEQVKMLLDAGEPVEGPASLAQSHSPKNARYSPLFYASANGHEDIVQLLLERGAGPNRRGLRGWTPLMAAALHGHTEIIALLMSSDAELKLESDVGRRALMYAVKSANPAAVQQLLDYGAELNHAVKNESGRGLSPLIYATQLAHAGVVQVLLNNDADVSHRDASGRRALEYAVQAGDLSLSRLLLAAESDPNQKDSHGNTVLHYLATSDQPALIELMLAAGADPHYKNVNGLSALSIAARRGYPDCVFLLLQGAGREAQLEALFHSVASTNVDAVAQVLNAGVSPNALNPQSETALMLAAKRGLTYMVNLLLERGANVALFNQQGRDALMYGVQGDEASVRVVESLLAAGADVRRRDQWGNTALLLAADQQSRYLSKSIFAVLLAGGSDVKARNSTGRTASMLLERTLRHDSVSRAEALNITEILNMM